MCREVDGAGGGGHGGVCSGEASQGGGVPLALGVSPAACESRTAMAGRVWVSRDDE